MDYPRHGRPWGSAAQPHTPPPPPAPEQQQQSSFTSETPAIKLECYLTHGIPTVDTYTTTTGTIPSTKIPSFLSPYWSPPDQNPPEASLRLVCVEQEWGVDHRFFQHPINPAVHKALGLPEDYGFLAWKGAGGCGRYTVATAVPGSSSALPAVVYFFHRTSASSTVSLVLRYNPKIKQTLGYLLHTRRMTNYLKEILEGIQLGFREWQHALVVPIVGVDLTCRILTEKMNSAHKDLMAVELKTGYSAWVSGPRDKAGADTTNQGGEGVSLEGLARQLGQLNGDFGFLDVAIATTALRVDFILRELEREQREGGPLLGNENVSERVGLLKSRLENLPFHCAIKDRLASQQTVLFNLISQQDSSVNIGLAADSKELAAASKRDSSSMKIIAILTTLFLPGTFISTLFAMPLFDWESSSLSDVANGGHFWFYWAITIPLTMLVMGFFGLYAWYQEREKKRSVQRAREGTTGDFKVKEV
ncbi:hypothetical protein QBC42DRAFT_229727 [Cladorrhinum samala]|uniref:Uncharacterized protein n=1 Tax=Cladorrhinum samala TaxID=585594 RepID=A0AAV9HLT7_9PEZI|nr:hypothetical protein QBC42DRAFT_229727 [Cladorrhinum samala]